MKTNDFFSTYARYFPVCISGVSVVALVVVMGCCRDEKSPLSKDSTLHANLFLTMLDTFFKSCSTLHQATATSNLNELSQLLEEASRYFTMAETNQQKREWIHAANHYEQAAKLFRTALEKGELNSPITNAKLAASLYQSSFSAVYGGQIQRAADLLSKPGIEHYPHTSRLNALQGIIALIQENFPEATRFFSLSLSADRNQPNIELLNLFAKSEMVSVPYVADHKRVITESKIGLEQNICGDIMHIHLQKNDYLALSLYVYAYSCLAEGKYLPVIAIAEYLLSNPDDSFPVKKEKLYCLLTQAYQVLQVLPKVDLYTIQLNAEESTGQVMTMVRVEMNGQMMKTPHEVFTGYVKVSKGEKRVLQQKQIEDMCAKYKKLADIEKKTDVELAGGLTTNHTNTQCSLKR